MDIFLHEYECVLDRANSTTQGTQLSMRWRILNNVLIRLVQRLFFAFGRRGGCGGLQ